MRFLSANEELFEKRLKTDAKRAPEKAAVPAEEAVVDSNHARSINRQMDWECSGCDARVDICGAQPRLSRTWVLRSDGASGPAASDMEHSAPSTSIESS